MKFYLNYLLTWYLNIKMFKSDHKQHVWKGSTYVNSKSYLLPASKYNVIITYQGV